FETDRCRRRPKRQLHFIDYSISLIYRTSLNIKDFKDADQSDIKTTAPPSFLNEFQVAEKEEKEE
ncbi:MAG: hypothetical protein SO365_03850, partial [Prevotella sp.]|nr:hypothetical protein [Prevotella sp.]